MEKHKNLRFPKSWKIRDAYRWIKKNYNLSISENEFSLILKEIGKIQREKLKQGIDIVFPMNMGKLSREFGETYVKVIDNKIKTNRLVDWVKSKEQGCRIYRENENYYYIKYKPGVNKQIKIYYGRQSTN